MSQIKPVPQINHIKRRAKAIAKFQNVQHTGALDLAAKEAGFENYRHALNRIEQEPEGISVELYASWHDRTSKPTFKYERLNIRLSKPLNEIISGRHLPYARGLHSFSLANGPNALSRNISSRSKEEAVESLCGAARGLAFIDATGLRPSTTRRSAYPTRKSPSRLIRGPMDHRSIPGQDHVSAWFVPGTRQYVITSEPYARGDEPYAEERRAWCNYFGYCEAKPNWIGIHAPHAGSRMYLYSKIEGGVELEPLIKALNRLPAPITAETCTTFNFD